MSDEPEVTVFSFAEHGRLLPPPEGTCQQCAATHRPDEPHDAASLHYQYWFLRQRGRWPNWADAMAHCSPEVQEAWRRNLWLLGVDSGQLEAKEEGA